MRKIGKGRRSGMTLVELLIAMCIALILTAVALPSVKTLLKDRKTNQAAMVIRSMIESAKVRSLAKGRPVAVVFERSFYVNPDPTQAAASQLNVVSNNTVTKMHIAEVLPPYQGDLAQSTCSLNLAASVIPLMSFMEPFQRQHYYMFRHVSGGGLAPRSDVNVASINLSENPSIGFFAKPGNLISFGDRDDLYEIVDLFIVGPTVHVVFWNQVLTPYRLTPSGLGPRYEYDSSNPQVPPPPATPRRAHSAPRTLPVGTTKFRIYSPPKRLYSKSIDLPKGTCVDLSLSGMANGPATINMFESLSSDLTTTPTYMVFSPNGTASEVWTYAGGSFNRFPISSNVYFYVGKTSQVVPPSSTIASSAASTTDTFLPNINDSSGYWIRVSAGTGQVVSASNKAPLSSLTPFVTPALDLEEFEYARSGATAGNDLSAK